MKRLAGNLLLTTVSVTLSLVVIEFALSILGLGSPYISGPSRLHDDILLYRLPAHYAAGIDGEGFRNPDRPETPEIVVLGDSHTYGYNAANDETWPRLLERAAGRVTYNAGMGGYGGAQYLYLGDALLARYRPKLLVVTVFLGNDLADTCYIADRLEYWRQEYARRGFDKLGCGNRGAGATAGETGPKGTWQGLNVWLRSTRTGSILLHRVVKPLGDEWKFRTNEATSSALQYRLDLPTLQTTLSSHYAHGEPESAAGLSILQNLLAEMADRARKVGAQFAVLIVPGKPSAVYEFARNAVGALPDAVRSDIEWERRYESDLTAYLGARNIPYANARPTIAAALARGEPDIYPMDIDDHPNPIGYRLYLQAFLSGMQKYGAIASLLRSGGQSR
jgi:hypothetical protein